MTPVLTGYVAGYVLACVAAVVLMVRHRRNLVLFRASYWRYLFKGWKLTTFAVAATAMVVIAPYTGDITWDYVDAAFMSTLTFLTAPWAVGTLFLALRRGSTIVEVYVMVCVWMFTVSWSYDLYILARDGYYPPTWTSNMVLSSILYFAGGLMWNLQWRERRGATFGFMEPGWPDGRIGFEFRRIVWVAIPFMLLAALMIGSFLF